MKLTTLGCGTFVPQAKKNPAGFLVETGDKTILLDAGYGVIRRLLDAGRDLQAIDLVFTSHFHPDHFSDTFNLIFCRKGNSMIMKKPARTLAILGPAGLKKRFNLWQKNLWPEWETLNQTYPVRFLEGACTVRLGGTRIKTFDVFHIKWFKSLGVVIESGKKKIAYFGDLGPKNDIGRLAAAARNTDLLVCEASVAAASEVHLTAEQARALSEAAGAKTTLLVHVSPPNEVSVAEFCAKTPGFILASDGMTFEI